MTARPVKVAFLADTADLRASLGKAEDAMESAAAQAKTSGQKIDSAFDSTAESADNVASKGAQAAGGLSGLGDLVGGKFGAAMVTGGIAMQGFADAGDLLNVVTESAIIRKGKDLAVTVAHAVATKAAAAAQAVMTAAQWALNAAMTANPIGLVILAIVALVAAFVIAYKKSATFRAIVNGAFDAIRTAAGKFASFFTHTIPDAVGRVISWVKSNWPKILAILTGPIGLAVLVIARHWDKIRDGVAAMRDRVVDKFNSLVSFVRDLPGRIAGATAGMFDGIREAFASAINWVIDRWNSLSFTLPSVNTHIPGVGTVGGFTLSTPDIPHLARGGIVNSPTFALIGEAGPEAVIPLRYLKNQARQTVINVKVEAPIGTDPYSIGESIVGFIREYEAGGGA